YRPAAEEDRGRARARLLPDRGDGGRVGGRRQGHRQAARGRFQGRLIDAVLAACFRGRASARPETVKKPPCGWILIINKFLIMPTLPWFAMGDLGKVE